MALGETLRRAREARRISLNQAALETRIRQAVLEALEDGDFTGVPPRPFLRGLLRNYALYLHLDADSVLDEYDYETGHKPAIARIPPPDPEPRATAPPATIAIAQEPRPVTPPPQPPEEPFTFPPFQIPTAPRMSGDADVGGANALPPAPGTVYQVAPELDAQPPEATAPLNLSQEPPTLARRIGSTRIPEAVALLSIGVALFILVSVGFTALENFSLPFATAPTEEPTRIPTATVPRGSTPTEIPVLLQTGEAPTSISSVITTTTPAATGSVTAAVGTATPTFDVPEDAQMTLEVQAVQELGVWVVVDGDTVFNGTLTNESRSFIARARMFMQIKNIENGRVFFQGTRILPRNQQERFDLYRAWFMNPLGTPVIVPPTPFPVPVEPTSPATFTPIPTATPTRTATPTVTETRTATATRSTTPSRTTTPSVTPSRTASVTRTPTASRTVTASATASSTRTVTRTPSATATRTMTPTATVSTATRTTTPRATVSTATHTTTRTATRTVTLGTQTRTATASRTQTATPTRTRTATPAASSEATITQAAPPLPSRPRP